MGSLERAWRKLAFAICLSALAATVIASTAGAGAAGNRSAAAPDPLRKINHIVVIYEENHSFDNLYGGWEGVNGRANAPADHTIQVGQAVPHVPYHCLMQNDVNLTSPPLSVDCTDTTTATTFTSRFFNAPFSIEQFIPKDARTCPQPGVFAPNGLTPDPANLPGGCTRDIVHRFYQEQYQLDGGKQDLYTTGSDAVGLTQGYYNTKDLPIYAYLHGGNHPHYAIADDFFQAAFGGSFLNHQWLIAAATPVWDGAPVANHSIVDSNGMPTSYPLYTATGPVLDRQLTRLCPPTGTVDPNPGLACGAYAVNTIQPAYQPFKGTPQLPPQEGTTIGDELSKNEISWAWYSGGWSNADGDVGGPGWTNGDVEGVCGDPDSAPNPTWPHCPNKVFQFHHQPFNYYANYAPDTPGRAHLQDEAEFIRLAKDSTSSCKLNAVSFVKPIGLENEHPGYTSETRGSSHLVELLQTIEGSACAEDTMVVVTYDEFGGQWDHVSPPGQGTTGPHDQWGPGTRLPTLIVSPFLRGNFVVDHTQYDTTSILATIERRFSLDHLSSRDAQVNDLSGVFSAKQYEAAGP